MVFQGENTLLTEDILKKKQEFIKTWAEWAADNLLQIVRDGDGGTTLYTVPTKKTLFITSVWITGSINPPISAEFARGGIQVRGSGAIALVHLIRVHIGSVIGQNQSNSLNFSMPIKLEQGAELLVSNDGADPGRFNGGFAGFEIDKRIS